jgi:hypothetical protein
MVLPVSYISIELIAYTVCSFVRIGCDSRKMCLAGNGPCSPRLNLFQQGFHFRPAWY